jgi:D-3-phosphoglycerate dehydrogenase / 2-oxoglutarate reductase
MIKVVITDGSFGSFDIEKGVLEPLGCEVVVHQGVATPAELAPLVADADYVLTQFAHVNSEVIAAMRRAKVIVRYGVGVDNVDLDAARARGIPVCNVPDYCLNEVADHTLALILATTRHVVVHCVGVRNGRWTLAVPLTSMKALCDLTVGVMGFGRIGREVVRRLQAFKCRVLVHDPLVPAGQIRDSGCVPASPEELFPQSDLVTLHLPATAQTRHMINRETIARMKPGAILVNVSRGSLVDSAALVDALERRHLSAAGLDVFDPEPILADSPLLRMENVIVSPHIASASENAVRMLRENAAGIVSKAIRGEPLPNVVNGVLARKP